MLSGVICKSNAFPPPSTVEYSSVAFSGSISQCQSRNSSMASIVTITSCSPLTNHCLNLDGSRKITNFSTYFKQVITSRMGLASSKQMRNTCRTYIEQRDLMQLKEVLPVGHRGVLPPSKKGVSCLCSTESVVVEECEAEVSGSESSTSLTSEQKSADISVHPTAVVHPDAILMEGVEVGPLCTVGSDAVIGPFCRLHPGCHVIGHTEIGEGSVIHSGAVVGSDIPGSTVIGRNNVIGCQAVVGVQCQDLKYQAGKACYLVIGDSNDIREHCSIHRSSKPDDKTVIGNNNLIMGGCHVAHDCKIGNGNILANGTLLAGHIVMEDFVHTGGATAVHQFCHIGKYSFLAGGAMVAQDVPMFTMVSGDRAEIRGLNVEGLRRHGFDPVEVRAIKRAYQKLFLASDTGQGFDERLTALLESKEMASEKCATDFLLSVKSSFEENRRGICKCRFQATDR